MLYRNHLANISIIVCTVAAAFGNSLIGGFVWDDNLVIANPVYHSFDLHTIFFSLANGLEYQPVRDITFLLDLAVWGANPFGFHLTNVVLFAFNCLLVYFLAIEVVRLLQNETQPQIFPTFVPLLTALFFAVHPLRSEVVSFVICRNVLVSGIFFFLSCLAYIRYLQADGARRKKCYAWALLCFVMAILSKATVIVLPAILVLFGLMHGRSGQKAGRFASTLPYWVLAVLFFFFNVAVALQTKVITLLPGEEAGLASRFALALQIPFFYLSRLFVPWRVSAIYEIQFAKSLLSPQVVAAFLMLAVLIVLAIAARKRFPELAFGGAWYLLALMPVLNFFATNPVVADRYFYLPSFGLCFMIASCGGRLAALRTGRKGAYACAALFLVPLMALTIARNRVWRNDITLWVDTAHRAAGVGDVWYNLGRAWHGLGRLDEALEAYLRAISINPYDLKSLDNAAALFPHTEEYRLIRAGLVRDLVAQFPPYPHGISLLGHTSAEWRDPQRAEVLFTRLLTVIPDSIKLHQALGNIYLRMGRGDLARQQFNAALNSGRDTGTAAYNLACLGVRDRNASEAVSYMQQAVGAGFDPVGLRNVDPCYPLLETMLKDRR